MADKLAPAGAPHAAGGHAADGTTKRDFLILATGGFAAVAAGAVAWPFISSMNPARDVLALSTTEADIGAVPVGGAVTLMWRGKPVFVRHRSPAEIEAAATVDMGELRDPQADSTRVKAGKAEWLVVIGVCTHLGCVPLGQKPTDPRGDYNGWFCPCHGSHYDTSGRIRKGPAPANLAVPTYAFTTDTQIKIG